MIKLTLKEKWEARQCRRRRKQRALAMAEAYKQSLPRQSLPRQPFVAAGGRTWWGKRWFWSTPDPSRTLIGNAWLWTKMVEAGKEIENTWAYWGVNERH